MAKRKSINFLPSVFRTLSNRRFLNTTVDQLIEEPALKKIYGYIGQQDQSPVFKPNDYYIAENDSYSQFYQLEPGTVIKKQSVNSNTYKISNVYSYTDLLNQIAADGGLNSDHQRLFTNRYYNYNGFVDLDKLTNYRQYYWVPTGPQTVSVTASGIPLQKDFYFHRVSYLANNQNELQSASIGQSGYNVDGYANEINPTITLQRGGTYNFNVNQANHKFYIQTEIGTSGTSSVQKNISTRDVFGVTNNGIDFGNITFNVPLRTDQDYLINLPAIENIDMVINNYSLSELQGVNYDTFIISNSLDGVRAFDTKYVYLTNENTIYQLSVQADRTMKLTVAFDFPNGYKSFVNQGDVYGHTFVYKTSNGIFKHFPTISAPQNILYYVDADDPLIYGQIQLVDPEPNSLLDVNDIIGRDYYTSPNGVKFTSGLKIKFTGLVTPASYKDKEYVIENVGKSIKLIDYESLVTPELINTNTGSSFGNSLGFGNGGFDGTTNSPEEKDYITINRASIDGNSWSRNNRWFHHDVLEYAANLNNSVYEFDSNKQAKRPIIEFLPDYKLWNYGTNYAGPVTVVDSTTTDAFSQVEGFNNYAVKTNGVYNSDGILLLPGTTVVFINDTNPTVRSTIYSVECVYQRAPATYTAITYDYTQVGNNKLYINNIANLAIGQLVIGNGIPSNTTITAIDSLASIVYISNNLTSDVAANTTFTFNNTATQIHLVPLKTIAEGDNIVALEGVKDQGREFYYADGVWNRAQIRNSRPQFPLFDIIDANGYSLGNQTVYPSSSFAGSQLFGYEVGTGTRDNVLGFALTYQNVGNIGDIVFKNFYITDTFDYNLNLADKVLPINIGYAAVILGWNNYNFANGWVEIKDKTKQYITKTFTVTSINKNNFDLGVKYSNSYYENNVFVYVNTVLQPITKYSLQTSATTSVIVFNKDLTVGDRLYVEINGIGNSYKQTYTMPLNLTNNSDNTEFSTITLGQIRNHLITIGNNSLNLVGEPAGNNNFRDLNYQNIGGKLLQHSSSLRPASLLFANNDVDPIRAINFARLSYTTFKNQLIDFINNLEFSDPHNYRNNLDTILYQFNQTANSNSPFYYTDMIAGGKNYIVNNYVVQNTTYRTYNLVKSYSKKPYSYNAVLVYLNGELLVKDFDYTIDNFSVVLTNDLTISRLDELTIYEYDSTLGCNIPSTPTKLGLYNAYKPEIIIDDTYTTPQTMIVGHDGSFTLAWGDYRDYILLEYEKRVYNNIAVKYTNNSDYDLCSVEPGAFRITDYTFDEWTQLLSSSYLSWANENKIDVFSNNTTSDSLFSFNYGSGIDKLFGQSLPGYWRGIYKYFYDTDRPHTHPWEMLGFVKKPTWWENRYGPSPYSSENNVLWNDLELGLIYNGSPDKSYVNSRYTRPGLSQIIPTDIHGNLLPPMQSVISAYDSNLAESNWRVGDQSPQETAWRRSSAYPFALQVAWALARPAEYCALKYNTRDVQYNDKLNQIINVESNSRFFDYTITSADMFIPGFNLWIRDLLVSNNLDPNINWVNIAKNSTFNLVYKMSGFTDKSYLTITADQVSPQSTNVSVLVPAENYQVKVTKSAPVARIVYSAVVVQKTTGGYQISGFDNNAPYFLCIPSKVSGNSYNISVANETAIIYKDSTNQIVSYPYGTLFSTTQQVVDFLISYGRYLENQGFIFNTVMADNQTIADWSLAAKEFLFFNQQNWGNNTVIGLTPAGTKLSYFNPFGVVDTLTNDQSYTKIVDSDGNTLTGRDYRVYREDNNFTIELKNYQKGIHLLDIAVVQYEHTIVFDNQTVFNDILYDEQVGSRQFRLRIDSVKTREWNGGLYAPGFFVNVTDIPAWVSYNDYYTGDIVLFKNQYYAAQKFIPGTQKFVASDWYKINGMLLSKELIPNMASGAAQFENFYNPDVADLNTAADILSKHSTGFQTRQYFTDLGLDITTQYKFYLGMITQKGTSSVLTSYLRNKQTRLDSDIKLSEQWAIKLSNYGGTNNEDKIEFNIGNSLAINNQYLFEFVGKSDQKSKEYNSINPQDLILSPKNYTTKPFARTEQDKIVVPYSGPVNLNDVDATVFDINKIFNISGLSPILGESSKIWIAADSKNEWGVYRLSQTGKVYATKVVQTSPNELTFTTNIPHGFTKYDYIMLKNARVSSASTSTGILDLSGFYRVNDTSNITFSVKIINNTTIASGEINALVFVLENVRYSTVNDFSNFIPVRGWQTGEIVYIDNDDAGYRVLENTDNWKLNAVRSPVFTTPTDNFGSSIRINSTQGFAIVGASTKSGTGKAFIYGRNTTGDWQEYGILTPDSRDTLFGANVDINNKSMAVITAPGNLKGSVYTANVNSQSVNLDQVIHYDNLNVISAGTSTSNAYLLISNISVFDATANSASINSYSLANFANGMTIVGNGIPTNTKISNITLGYPYHKIGLTAVSTISANQKISIYPNLIPSSNFGASATTSLDGKWLFVGEPTMQRVFVYKEVIVDPSTANRVGDGSSCSFSLPPTALALNLGSRDITVILNGIIQKPDLDYIKTPSQDSITFAVAPASGATISIVYKNYYKEVNQIITTDNQASGFGSSLSCTADGRQLVVGAYNSTATFDTTYASAGKAYVYERTVENFEADGYSTLFQLSNAFVGSNFITTPNVITNPSVTVDGANAAATFNVLTNQVILANLPVRGSTVSVETNQFILTNTLVASTGQINSNFGQTVKITANDSSLYIGAPGTNTTSGNNGVAYRFVNIPRQYGIITGTTNNFAMVANYSMRINDWLVTFTGGDVNQCAADINSTNIPGVSARVTENKTIQITSDSHIAYNKLRFRNEYGDAMSILGLYPWNLEQTFYSPINMDCQRFGESISVSYDTNTVVIGTTLSNTRITTSFDSLGTTFDKKSTRYIDSVYRSGVAHVYEYQKTSTETVDNRGVFVYATLLNNSTANSLDKYATAIDVSQNYILIGSPHANVLNNPTGTLNIYYNKNADPIWNEIRTKPASFDSRLIKRAYIYNSNTSKLIMDLPIIDLTHGKLPNNAEEYIDFIINYDPAVYSNVPSTISFSYDRKNNWGIEKVGKLWWDTNSIKYYDNTQGSTLEQFNNWGFAFPSSEVFVYEWIESDLLPKDYARENPLTPPLYTVSDVYSTKVVIDNTTGVAMTKYYFWVRNNSKVNQLYNRPSALELQSSIASPRANPQPFIAVINESAFGLFNAQNIVDFNTNIVIEYKNKVNPQLTHTEWTMFDDGTDLGVAAEFIQKLSDSLSGQDSSGRIVPDPNLSLNQKYGMNFRPRQSLFSDAFTARKYYVEKLNTICAKYPMVLTRPQAVTAFNISEPLPDIDKYKTSVADIVELGYLDKNLYKAGEKVLVVNDSTTYNNGWIIYELKIVEPNTRSWIPFQVQTYNVNNYWILSDWYSSNYNSQTPITHTIEKESEVSMLSLNVNDIIYIKNSNDGGWKIVLVKNNNLELLAQQNATIKFTDNLFNKSVAGQGFESSSIEATGFATDSSLEFSLIFDIVKNNLLINEYRSEWKSLIMLLVDTISTQHLQTDFLMKTSLVDIYHRVRGLDQLPVYLPQSESTVTSFFNEVKPYHTKLKQYIATYDNNNNIETAYQSITDFDLQPYFNTVISKYRSPQLGNSLDTNILNTTSIYQPWVNNHLYSVKRIDIVDGGSGYLGNVTVTITGDGTGATAKAHILNGSIYTIEITNGGIGYTFANVNISGTGTGAKSIALVGNGLPRTFNTYLKLDRITYFKSVSDWTENTVYNIDDVVVYNAQPYRTIVQHTSIAKFDFTKFLPLIVKVWYPLTQYALNDIVIYNQTSYLATSSFISNELFDSNNLIPYNGIWLDNAADRVWSYYYPKNGMAGRDLAQVMFGMEYNGIKIFGPDFKQSPYYDINNFDTIPYDYISKDVNNVLDVFGAQSEDTIIQSIFTDTSIGFRPSDINLLGGEFVDKFSSNAPEELIPGIINDTLDIKIITQPLVNGSPDLIIIQGKPDKNNSYSFDPKITKVNFPIGGIEKFFIIDYEQGPIAEGSDYTVNWQTQQIQLNYIPSNTTTLYSIMIGSNGLNPVMDTDFIADGTQIDFDIPNFILSDVQQAYVKINGQSVSNWSLVNKLENNKTILSVRFSTPPTAGSYLQVHLYTVAIGKRAYSEIYEQTFSIDSAIYPTGYNFTLSNPEIYKEPLSAYSIVRLNTADLLPPQQSYYYGDGILTNFSLTNAWTETLSKIVDGEIMVLVNNTLMVQYQDYTVYRDGINMPVVQFNIAPALGSLITISDSSQSDYKIYDGNQLWLNKNLTIPPNSKISILTQGNHDNNNMFTKLFSGNTSGSSVIDQGFDQYGFDTLGFDNELTNIITNVYYTLPRAVTNINQIYVTLKTPGTIGGYPLIPYTDFVLTNPTTISLSNNLQIFPTSTIIIRIFGENTREYTIQYRIFKDIRDRVRYYAVKKSGQTRLKTTLLPTDQWIYCENVATLQSPQPNINQSGVIIINGERITYGIIDLINNRLGNLRRGTAGTGIAASHQAGTLIIDSGIALEIPNSRDTLITTDKATYLTNTMGASILINQGDSFYQGKLFQNIGESLQTSQTPFSKFIRDK